MSSVWLSLGAPTQVCQSNDRFIMSAAVVFVLTLTVVTVSAITPHQWCYKDHPILDGLICYKECRSGFKHKGGGPVCWAICPPRTTDIGALCTKDSYGRGVGKPLSTCTSSQEKNGLLCYPKCRSGYYGVGPVCWSHCRSGYADDGALCRRNAHIYSRDVGSCPWHDKCGLCGGPWYNVCGKRRNCGGSCRSGYHNDGCTCRRDVHIYAKSTYGRGAGSAMGCKSDEQKDAALCYPHCSSGYKGVGPVCWAHCSGETKDTGMQCQKNSYGRGVGKAINCLKIPSLNDLTNYTGLVDIFEKAENLQGIQAIGCSAMYIQTKFWVTLAQTFNNCNRKSNFQTISVSYTAGAAAGVQVSGEIGIAVDIFTSDGICYVGYCMGVKTDISIGADLAIGWWRNLDDIPGKSTAFELGVDIPFTEIGFTAVFIVNTDDEFIGTQFSFGIGVGLLPFEVGFSSCNTPPEAVIKFKM